MPRPSNQSQRRRQIARAMMSLLAQRGYDGTSIAAVAKRAELNQGLLHYHFKNKQEILLEVVLELGSGHLEKLEAKLQEAGEDPIARLVAFIDLHLGLGSAADREALACWIVLTAEAMRKPEINAQYQSVIDSLRVSLKEIIEEGVSRNLFSGGDTEARTGGILASIQGYFVMSATTPQLVPKGSAVRCVLKMAQGLLAPTRPFPKIGTRHKQEVPK